MMVSESATVSGFILPGNHRSSTYAITYDAVYSCGFMLWDGTSKGTLTNVINLLDYNKKVLLFSAPKKQFFTLRTAGDLDHTLRASGIRDVAAVLASLESKHVTTEHLRFTGLNP
jgi:hypothetical protein